jgi:hypothetical protein
LTTYEGIKRAGPPQAIQKLREDLYMVQITLSETPSAMGGKLDEERRRRREEHQREQQELASVNARWEKL